ncbi:hypothetical protein L6164_035576 [Bauhinia variegata]|uniref:Uncharacterized protein n=1 Tax=Bauhinia variegata TaxID=167791 RepID=A0ACB9KED0_BAUVA|nr:hypothetical protein L6164_035576 [Bauhinia variegata]
MRFVLALPLLLLFFLGATVESRKDAGEYWRMVMKDQAMPEAIQGLLNLDSDIQSETKHKTHEHKCEEPLVAETNKNKVFAGEFEPRPNISAYKDGEEKKFIKDFEPKPSFWVYDEEDKVGSVNDFEPRPNVSAYEDNKVSSVNNDFEPRLNLSGYND